MSMNSDVDSKKFHFSVREPDIRIKVIMISKDLSFENHYRRQKAYQSAFYFVIICSHFLVTILGSTCPILILSGSLSCCGCPDFLREARGFLDGMVTGGSLVGVEVGVELGFQDSSKSLSY